MINVACVYGATNHHLKPLVKVLTRLLSCSIGQLRRRNCIASSEASVHMPLRAHATNQFVNFCRLSELRLSEQVGQVRHQPFRLDRSELPKLSFVTCVSLTSVVEIYTKLALASAQCCSTSLHKTQPEAHSKICETRTQEPTSQI